MPKITDASNGENTNPAGTESLPLTGSKYSTLNTIKTWLTNFFVGKTGNETVAGNKTFTGYTSFIPPTDNVVVGSGVYVELNGDDLGVDIEQFQPSSDSDDYLRSPLYLYRQREGDGNLTAPLIWGEQFWYSVDSVPISGDFLKFDNNNGDVFTVDKDGWIIVGSSGVYTPTRSAESNLDSNVTMTEAQYFRVGSTVTVSGRFTADPTTTLTLTSFEITLPVTSNVGAAEDVAGVAFCGTITGQGAMIFGVAANNTAKVQWLTSDVTSQTWSYIFSYQVI